MRLLQKITTGCERITYGIDNYSIYPLSLGLPTAMGCVTITRLARRAMRSKDLRKNIFLFDWEHVEAMAFAEDALRKASTPLAIKTTIRQEDLA